jgi:hypothetical protein
MHSDRKSNLTSDTQKLCNIFSNPSPAIIIFCQVNNNVAVALLVSMLYSLYCESRLELCDMFPFLAAASLPAPSGINFCGECFCYTSSPTSGSATVSTSSLPHHHLVHK